MDDDLIRNDQSIFDEIASGADGAAPPVEVPKVRDEDEIPTARETQSSAQPDALVSYLRSISATPVLSREQQYELAEAIETHREAFLDAVFAVPATASVLVRRWRERKAAGYVTATFSAHHLDGSGRDLSAEIDKALSAIEKLIGRRDATTRSSDAKGQAEMLDRRIARALRSAELSFDVVVDVYRELAQPAPRRSVARCSGGARTDEGRHESRWRGTRATSAPSFATT